MQLGETIATYDVALALRGESGKFEVTCPTGEAFHVTCKPNHSIANLEWSGERAEPQPFVVRKIAEPVTLEIGRITAPTASGTQPPVRAPFLLENQGEESKSETVHERVSVLQKTEEDRFESRETAIVDLLYVESDARSKQPSACICLKGGPSDPPLRLLTTACASLNEFDSEIRRLHAQLDEVRSRARKLFYKAHAVAESA